MYDSLFTLFIAHKAELSVEWMCNGKMKIEEIEKMKLEMVIKLQHYLSACNLFRSHFALCFAKSNERICKCDSVIHFHYNYL